MFPILQLILPWCRTRNLWMYVLVVGRHSRIECVTLHINYLKYPSMYPYLKHLSYIHKKEKIVSYFTVKYCNKSLNYL